MKNFNIFTLSTSGVYIIYVVVAVICLFCKQSSRKAVRALILRDRRITPKFLCVIPCFVAVIKNFRIKMIPATKYGTCIAG